MNPLRSYFEQSVQIKEIEKGKSVVYDTAEASQAVISQQLDVLGDDKVCLRMDTESKDACRGATSKKGLIKKRQLIVYMILKLSLIVKPHVTRQLSCLAGKSKNYRHTTVKILILRSALGETNTSLRACRVQRTTREPWSEDLSDGLVI